MVGGIREINVSEKAKIQLGANLRNFFNWEGGTALGLMAAVGTAPQNEDKVTLPLQLRFDVVFGEVTWYCINAGIGIQWYKH